MTGPFGPELRPPIVIVFTLILAFAIAMPFARRDDWIGWCAFLVILAAAVGLWAVLLWGFTRQFVEWWQKRSKSDER